MIFSKLQKLKNTLIMSLCSFIGAVLFWSVLNISECNRQAERILRSTPIGIPQNIHSKIPETPFTLRRSFAGELFSILNTRRSGNNPIPPAHRLYTLPLAQTIYIQGEYIPEYSFNAERFVFQNYLRRSIPQRAGPSVS